MSPLPPQYLNSGAGGISGIFLHDRYADSPPPHLHGWWSNSKATRFDMADKVELEKGADSFRLCNPPPFLAALNMASLEARSPFLIIINLSMTTRCHHGWSKPVSKQSTVPDQVKFI